MPIVIPNEIEVLREEIDNFIVAEMELEDIIFHLEENQQEIC